MIKILKRNFLAIILVLAIIIVYFAFRLPNLTLQPIFVDEAIYIRWAQVMRSEPTLRFLPLSDGKTPLFMWVMIPLFKIIKDPLFAGRFLSVLSGLATLSAVLFLGWKFFGRSVGVWSAFLVAITPFMVFFDRMALTDSMLTAFSIWSLNLALLLVSFPRLDLSMIVGYVMGGSILVKTPGFFNILTLPATLIIFNWSKNKRPLRLLKLAALWAVAIVIALAMYNILRLGPGFQSLSSRNQDYIFSPFFILTRLHDPFIPHLKDIADWFPKLLTIPILGLFAYGSILAFFKKDRLAISILVWGVLPLLTQMFLLKTFTARYIHFSIPPLLLLSGFGLSNLLSKVKINKKLVTFLALIVLLPQPLNFNLLLLQNPQKAPLPKNERQGYFEQWTAGYGLDKIASFLEREAVKKPIVVGTEGYFGTLPDGLFIYLDRSKNISIVPGKGTISAQLRDAAQKHPTFFVSNKSRFSSGKQVELLKEFPKAKPQDGDQDAILLFWVLPEVEN